MGCQHLQCHDAVHRVVLGLVHPAHAAAADFIQDAVLSQHEPGHAARQQVFRLEAGEQPLLNQESGDDSAAVGGRQSIRHCAQLFRVEQPTLFEVAQEGVAVDGL